MPFRTKSLLGAVCSLDQHIAGVSAWAPMQAKTEERWVVEANIVRFQGLLKAADQDQQRELLKRLLLREHEKLAELNKRV